MMIMIFQNSGHFHAFISAHSYIRTKQFRACSSFFRSAGIGKFLRKTFSCFTSLRTWLYAKKNHTPSTACMRINNTLKAISTHRSISYATLLSIKLLPTIECHTHIKHKQNMLAMAYWYSEVRYDTVGNDRLITHLKDTLVRSRVYVVCSRFWGSRQSTENIVSAEIVIKKMRKYALDM